ncbi:MAG: hypothetical protein RLZZ165_1766, partial [Bacteroidota bacterium]
MLRTKQTYYYDTEKCTYTPAKLTLASVARKSAIYIVFGLAAALVGKYHFDQYFLQLKSSELRERNESLLGRLNDINGRIDQFERKLYAVYEKENALYLPIVGENIIPASRWNAGTGGEAIFDKSVNNAAYKTSLRLSSLKSRLALLDNHLEKILTKSREIDIKLSRMPSIQPVNGALMSGFGFRNHPVTGGYKFHEGLDFACPPGTPVYASGNGRVEIAGDGEQGYGICLNLNHGNGYRSKYAHLSQMLVKNGQEVKRGQLIAYSGNTGLSSGPHLHYEVSINEVKVDPLDFIYMDLSPDEYLRLKLDKKSASREAIREKLVAPSMD